MHWMKILLSIVLAWLISFSLDAAQTLTYGPESKPVAGVKITMTESGGMITILSTDTEGTVTFPSAGNSFTLTASLAETGTDPVDLLDAIWILQHSGELRTLSPNLVFLDTATGNPLSETTFSPTDTPSITVIRMGDVDQSFDPGG